MTKVKKKLLVILSAIAFLVWGVFGVRTIERLSSTRHHAEDVAQKLRLYRANEIGYLNGQMDAVNGDIRVRKDSAGCFVWARSPWGGPDSIKILKSLGGIPEYTTQFKRQCPEKEGVRK
jgi:hypothetical protein